jgi:hypothetical protein
MLEIVDQLKNRAAIELQAASGGEALCRLTASGSPGNRVKRAEGRWAALNALSRSLGTEDCDSLVLAQKLISQWQSDVDRWSEHPGSSWIPYCEGGLEGLREFVEIMRESEFV